MHSSENKGNNFYKSLVNILKSDIFIIIIIYSLAHFLILLNNGIYWDDWIYFNWNINDMIYQFSQFGNVFLGYYFYYIFSLSFGVFLFRVLIFLSFLLSAILLNETLKTIKEINMMSRLMLVLFFAIIPVNIARIVISTSQYSLCYFFFFFGLWLISRYLITRAIYLRIAALVFLFLSFFTNSFLVFYSIILLYIAYIELKNVALFDIYKLLLKYLDFVIMPFLFWVIRLIFFKPYGLYDNYNSITISNLILIPYNFYIALSNILMEFIIIPGSTLFIFLLLILILLPLVYLLIRKKYDNDKNKDSRFFILGLIFLVIALFAYLSVGKIPSYFGLESRHELLLPLGLSFTLLYGFNIIANKLKLNTTIKVLALSIIIVLFICINISNYLAYQADTYKQLSLIEQFESSNIIEKYTTFLFIDNSTDLNARDRAYNFYEYTGMMAYAYGDETRFGCDKNTFTGIEYYRSYSQYKYSDYVEHEPEYLITINKGDYSLDNEGLLQLMLDERFNHDEFRKYSINITKLEYEKIQ